MRGVMPSSTTSHSPSILVVRNDKIGDFMLAWAAIALLRKNLPNALISVLVPAYTADLARLNSDIDEILIDQQASTAELANQLKAHHYDAVLCLYSTRRVALAAWQAHIPIRLAPATKWWQWLFNKRLVQRRSRSLKPEYEYNLDCARALLKQLGVDSIQAVKPPYLSYQSSSIQQTLQQQLKLDSEKFLVLIHCGDGGSARNLSLAQYRHLAQRISAKWPCQMVFTAGPGEFTAAQQQAAQIPGSQYFLSDQGIETFVCLIAMADLFISGSTGPLHIAGALDTPTLGFYPKRRSATALRWQTLNSDKRRQACAPAEHAEDEDMNLIDLDLCLAQLQGWWPK